MTRSQPRSFRGCTVCWQAASLPPRHYELSNSNRFTVRTFRCRSGRRCRTWEIEKRRRESMAVKFNLVGLINFFDLGRDGKLLLIPDGTNPPGPGHIPQHFAGIFVLARQVLTHAEWPSVD